MVSETRGIVIINLHAGIMFEVSPQLCEIYVRLYTVPSSADINYSVTFVTQFNF